MKKKLSIFLYNTLRYSVNKLPAGAGRYLGKFIAHLGYLITPERRKRVTSNLKKALDLSGEQAKKLLKDVYQNLGYNFAEFLQEDQLSSEEIEDIVDFKGLEYLDQALEEGKGVIIYTAHLGNWELMGTALSRRGYSVDAIAREQNDSTFDEKINEIRKNSGIGIIPKGLAVRRVFKSLRRNSSVVVLGDQDAREHGWKLKFFGRDASTYPGAVQFAKRTGAPIVPVFIHRRGWLKHELKCYPPRYIDQEAEEDELKYELQDLLKLTEEEILKKPDDWMWLHKRWKTYS